MPDYAPGTPSGGAVLPRHRRFDCVLQRADGLGRDRTRTGRGDHVVFASGYRADLGNVPYLRGVLEQIELADGFPVLDESFQTTLDGLYITGFSATRDFGPFFGFVKGCPAAATLIVRDVLARASVNTTA
jgi:hypothetical protein